MQSKDPALYLMSAAFLASSCGTGPASGTDAPAPGGLRRGANWGFQLVASASAPGAVVHGLADGAAARAGLKNGDRVLRINHVTLADPRSIAGARHAHRAGDRIELEVARGAGGTPLSFILPALPAESIPRCSVEYGSVLSPRGYRVRTIISRPNGAKGRLPAILFVPWLSCDPVEAPLGPGDGWIRLLRGLSEQSGWVVMRVEKPGVGDSEGPDCSGNDLETDLDAFRAGLKALRGRNDVDTSRIVLFGGSIGGALAPLLAVEQPVAGLIVAGTFSRTWFEHMLEIERQRLGFQGAPPAEINRALRGFAEFYALYLGQSLTPGEVIARRPDLKPLWYDAPDGQYGRPAAYYHQVARLNVEEAWTRLEVPVLVLYGEFDWIMSRTEHEHIAAMVNARRPGLATLEVLPGMDHNLEIYATREDAFHGRGARFDDGLIERVTKWLSLHVSHQ